MLTLISLNVFYASADDLKSSLNTAIEQSILPGELSKELLEKNFKAWPGHDTLDGAIKFYDAWKEAVENYNNYTNHKDWNKLVMTREENLICDKIPAFATMQGWLGVPQADIVTYLIQRVEKSEMGELFQNMNFLSFYSGDLKAAKCFASLLNDKRQFYETRGSNTFPSGRVCDTAFLILRKRIEKEGVLKWGDPGFVWDSPSVEDSNNNIAAIRSYLIAEGVIEDSKKSAADMRPHQKAETGSEGAGNTRQVKHGVPENKESAGHLAGEGETRVWRVIAWGAGVVCVMSLLWLYLRKRALRE